MTVPFRGDDPPSPPAPPAGGKPGDVIPPRLANAAAELRVADEADAVAGVRPAFVASPASTEEASAVLAAAAELGLAVVPRGAGTRLDWGLPPSRCDLVVDTRRLDQVLEHAAGDLVVRVQAGVRLGRLAQVLGAAGQRLALDPPGGVDRDGGDQASGDQGSADQGGTVGGLIATGVAGPLRLRYGAPRDLLIGITMVRADGTVARAGGKVVKNVAGYDIGKLLAGSYGTLALITEATFRLHPRAAAVTWVTADFDPSALAGAASAVASAAGSALVPSAVELLWTGSPVMLRAGVLLEGTPSGVNDRAKQMAELLAAAGATLVSVQSGTPFPWWEPGPEPGTVVRVTFWVAQLAEVLEALAGAGASAGVRPAVGGPAGAGVLYAQLDPAIGDGTAAQFVRGLRDRLEGVFAGSADGSGLVRGGMTVLAAPTAVRAAAGPDGPLPGLDLMRAVKDQFDPDHRMFPGRLLWER